ncbi:hypothetical protein LCGC14_1763250, partial [marine sediment metagenome]
DRKNWLFVNRRGANGGTGGQNGEQVPENPDGDKLITNPFVFYQFEIDRGPVWPACSTHDENGTLWVAGYMDNVIDNAKGILGNRSAKLWRVDMIDDQATYAVKIREYDLAELDPTGRIHHPELMVYDDVSNTLTLWGDLDPDGDYGIVQFDIDTSSIINSRYYVRAGGPAEPKLQPQDFNVGGPSASAIFSGYLQYFANGTDDLGNIPFLAFGAVADDDWTVFNARNFTFTTDQPGPFISGFISQRYWYKSLDRLYIWNGVLGDNPSDVDPESFERLTIPASNDTVDEVVKSLMNDVRIPNSEIVTDAAMASLVVDGYIVANQGRVRDAINPLGFTFFFDALEADSKIAFRTRGTSSIRTIPQADLGARAGSDGKGEDDLIVSTRTQETDIPERVDIQYMEVSRDYLEGNQHAQRARDPSRTQFSDSVFQAAVPIVMSSGQAKGLAEAKLYDSWSARVAYELTLGPKHMDLEPTDVITVLKDGEDNRVIRLAELTLGEAFATQVASIAHDPETLTTVGTGADVPVSGGLLIFQGPTQLFMMDTPFLLDEHSNGGVTSGVYLAMSGIRSDWITGLITKSESGNAGPFELFDVSKGGHAWGFLNTTLQSLPDVTENLLQIFNEAYHVFRPDDTIVIDMVFGESLISSSTLLLMNETQVNVGILIDTTDKAKFEVFQYKDVSIVSGVATLTGLLRGLRGTEPMGKGGFSKGSTAVVFLDREVTTRKQLPLTDINTNKIYRVQTAREVLETSQLINFVLQAGDLKPLSAGDVDVDLAVGSRAASSIVVNWKRRTRLGGEDDFADEVTEIPLSESSEAYEVDILDDGLETVDKTFTGLTTPSVTITAAERTNAGYTDNVAVRLKIYQISGQAVVGRGWARDVTI